MYQSVESGSSWAAAPFPKDTGRPTRFRPFLPHPQDDANIQVLLLRLIPSSEAIGRLHETDQGAGPTLGVQPREEGGDGWPKRRPFWNRLPHLVLFSLIKLQCQTFPADRLLARLIVKRGCGPGAEVDPDSGSTLSTTRCGISCSTQVYSSLVEEIREIQGLTEREQADVVRADVCRADAEP